MRPYADADEISKGCDEDAPMAMGDGWREPDVGDRDARY
jgi:hypothetical protein